jgi:hypothetical protein
MHGRTTIAATLLVAAHAHADQFHDLESYLAATSDNDLIDFDTLPDGSPAPPSGDILDDYAAYGVLFPPANHYQAIDNPVSGTHAWENNTGDALLRTFDAEITDPEITAVGVWQPLFIGGVSTVLEAFDADGQSLGTVAGDNNLNTADFFGLTTDEPIATIVIEFGIPITWALDDLYVGKAGAACPADVNADGELNVLDFVAFQQLWQQQDPAADCDDSATYDILDFVCFQQLFQAGCA